MSERLLDVGCGPVLPDYAYADKARHILCIDWNLVKVGDPPAHVECNSGDFLKAPLEDEYYDVIVAADVFEHIKLEDEPNFIKKCVSVLRPNGRLVLSVPHKGTFAWLDPYEVKPLRDRLRAKLGLFDKLHNGDCDIRKGHKHYTLEEISRQFDELRVEKVVYWGHLFDPLLSWAFAILGQGSKSPLVRWLERRTEAEQSRDFGAASFNMAVVFVKPT
jgi:predicted SAM-dependent methyltransferase